MNIKSTLLVFFGILIACGSSAVGQTNDANADTQCTCTGQQGPMGPTGLTGVEGPAGTAGAPGAQGPQGPQGLQGDPGAQGTQGPQGVQGPQGTAGTNGTVTSKTDLYIVTKAITVPANGGATVIAACKDTNDILLSGSCSGGGHLGMYPTVQSWPENVSSTTLAADWYCEGGNESSSSFTLTATAVCVNIP
jgi:Collagen triple helix repeat (20 copies)